MSEQHFGRVGSLSKCSQGLGRSHCEQRLSLQGMSHNIIDAFCSGHIGIDFFSYALDSDTGYMTASGPCPVFKGQSVHFLPSCRAPF